MSTGRQLPDDIHFLPTRATGTQVCALPPRGGTVTVITTRDALGRVTSILPQGRTGPTESWTNVSDGQVVAVMTDTATLRIAAADPRWQATFDTLATLVDTSIGPFFASFTRGIPDTDGNGKLIVYVSGSAAIPVSFASNSGMRADCPAGTAGESIFLNWSFGPDVGPVLQGAVVAHEVGHIIDWAWNEHVTLSGWALEGFATFASSFYLARGAADPLGANFASLPRAPDGSASNCFWRPSEAFADAPNGPLWSYAMGCNMVGYLIQRRRERFGETIKEAITAWTKVPNTATMEDADSYLGVARGASGSFGRWALSLYADDYVAGIPPELRQPMWNMRALWTTTISSRDPFPLPEVVLSGSAPSATFRLGAPGARYVELGAASDAMLTVTRTGPTSADMGLLVLRAR
jgi:hypothetical protein